MKFVVSGLPAPVVLSLPSRERGLKLKEIRDGEGELPSLPSRERGLKFLLFAPPLLPILSLPSRERGLKYIRDRG